MMDEEAPVSIGDHLAAQAKKDDAIPVLIIGAIRNEEGMRIMVYTQMPPPLALEVLTQAMGSINQAVVEYIGTLEGKLALAAAKPRLLIPNHQENDG